MYNPTDFLYTQRCANATNILYTQHFLLKIRNSKISSFCYAHKRPSPFSYISPQKTHFSTIKYELTIEFLSANGENGKKGPPTNPTIAPPQKFLLLLRYNLFIGVHKMHVKNITVTVSVRVSATVRVSLVLFISSNTWCVECRHLPTLCI